MKDADSGVIYFPGLNGLRALAALVVVAGHVTHFLSAFGLEERHAPNVGAFGVTVFFALSGFLITFLLLREREKTDAIHLRAFYARRILRIWPLYFFYLLLCVASNQPRDSNHIAYYLFMAPNLPYIFGGGIRHAEHYWSLGVEEQFYAFWPILVKHARRIRTTLIAFVVLILLARFIVMRLYGGWSQLYELAYSTRFDCMAIGGLGACQLARDPAWCRRLANRVIEGLSWLFIVLVATGSLRVSSFFLHDLVAAATVLIILGQITNSRPFISLENRPLDFVGRVSFGVYVYHPLVIGLCAVALRGVALPPAVKYPLVYFFVLASTLAVAQFSHRFLERPFLRLKERHSLVRSRSGMTA